MPHFKKWVIFGKMNYTLKNGSHLEVKQQKASSTREINEFLGKWITLGKYFTFTILKTGHTWKNGLHSEKCVTVGKIGDT